MSTSLMLGELSDNSVSGQVHFSPHGILYLNFTEQIVYHLYAVNSYIFLIYGIYLKIK